MKAIQRFGQQPKYLLVAEAVAFVILLGVLDQLTGREFSLSLFYLIPILLVTHFVGKWAGIMLSFASAVTWLLADLMGGPAHSHSVIPYWNAVVRLCYFLGFIYLLSLKVALRFAQDEAVTDVLTTVLNRRGFYQGLRLEIERARRNGEPLTIVCIDLDGFKNINDRFGHDSGDLVLREVASTLRENLRVTDWVARLGGDEFALLLPGLADDPAATFLLKIQALLRETMKQRNWSVTFSIGSVTFVSPPSSVEAMLKKADEMMYRVKHDGKDGLRHEVVSE